MSKLRKVNNDFVVTDPQLKFADELFLECDNNNFLEIEIKVLDKRQITDKQRRFIFALCNEISYFTGTDKDFVRLLLQQYNANLREIKVESLSACSVTYANGLIDTIIDYCIDNEIPISNQLIKDNAYRFNENQVYMMCLKRTCVVCGGKADIHHVDHVGMGNNRQKISHVGKRILPLCRKHHQEIHNKGEQRFIDEYHLTTTVVDEKMDYFIKKGKIKTFK